MTWPDLSGLDVTPEEELALAEVLDELAERDEQLAAEVMADLEADLDGLPDDGGDGGLDGYGLANDDELDELASMDNLGGWRPRGDGGLDGLAELNGLLDHQLDTERTRAEQDLADALAPRRSSEVRLAQALSRIQAGTYLPAGQFRDPAAARDAHGQFTGRACGPYDSGSGRCSARYHAAGCLEVARGEAATGSADAALAWRAQLSRPEMTAGMALANDAGDAFDAAAGIPGPVDPATLNAVRAALGLPAIPQAAAGPAAAGPLADGLGLR